MGKVIIVCGKIASGKSYYSRKIKDSLNAVIISPDEATSALDNETQSKIQKAIDNLKDDYTILIIAHRLSTIVNFDRILVLDGGKIKAEGTHEQLLKRSKTYKKLYETENIE